MEESLASTENIDVFTLGGPENCVQNPANNLSGCPAMVLEELLRCTDLEYHLEVDEFVLDGLEDDVEEEQSSVAGSKRNSAKNNAGSTKPHGRVTGRPQILTLQIEGFRHPLYSLVSCIEITTRESPKSVHFAFEKGPIYLRTSSYSAMGRSGLFTGMFRKLRGGRVTGRPQINWSFFVGQLNKF